MTVAEKTIDINKFTLNDINVGSKLYEVLVAHVVGKGGQPIYYSDLLEAAKHAFPHDEEMHRAVPIGIGTKLLFVEAFCALNDYPNLACLAVNRSTGVPGTGYKGDWETEKNAIAKFNWANAKPALDAFVIAATTAVTPKTRLNQNAAADVVWKHYKEHRDTLYKGKPIPEHQKAEMTNLVMEGFSADASLQMVLDMVKNGDDDAATV